MNISTKYTPGDKVFVLESNSIHQVTIELITVFVCRNQSGYKNENPISISEEIRVRFKGGDFNRAYHESQIFDTVDKLIDNIRRPHNAPPDQLDPN